ncbi:hypothetical protein [Conservatibacter flavescens]|uniref:PRD domain-containing protein n=1 Tax=Conservatibacter flavescens TaxID=28161 RepID=A0A2M8S1F3_9PAST|nr:hypothetical protein [Conservatibacter flavescens]PJG84970.1 hypothetical protein CVP05_09070 [Conservatibacter flavescens]
MNTYQRLVLLEKIKLIDEQIMHVVLQIEQHLAQQWQVNTQTKQMEILLIHLANSLGRIRRGFSAQPLNSDMFAEIQSAADFPKILHLHNEILSFIPFVIPQSEQTHFIANIYSLTLDQPIILEK